LWHHQHPDQHWHEQRRLNLRSVVLERGIDRGRDLILVDWCGDQQLDLGGAIQLVLGRANHLRWLDDLRRHQRILLHRVDQCIHLHRVDQRIHLHWVDRRIHLHWRRDDHRRGVEHQRRCDDWRLLDDRHHRCGHLW
jgi:hypothetical protein